MDKLTHADSNTRTREGRGGGSFISSHLKPHLSQRCANERVMEILDSPVNESITAIKRASLLPLPRLDPRLRSLTRRSVISLEKSSAPESTGGVPPKDGRNEEG
ncbi:hypothetical protein BaRGS_00039508 [Batillaria attramentaria]|uniref:Uncharacterized protein n=1 Tax=Batillaria attramentaria TaxID=370345 RepID=A0ABD0J3F2_9CAEN